MAKIKIIPTKKPMHDFPLREIKSKIEQISLQVAIQVNQSLTLLYWKIGDNLYRHVLDRSRAEFRKEIPATVLRLI